MKKIFITLFLLSILVLGVIQTQADPWPVPINGGGTCQNIILIDK